jgi:ferric-dicitrate binding protein FerR (iron transport regulator)
MLHFLEYQADGAAIVTDLGEIKHDLFSNRRWFLRRCVLALPLYLVVSPAPAAEAAGSVEDVSGEAFAEAHAVRRLLERLAPVFLRDQVGTGAASRLGMRLGRDTTIRLGENARLRIDRFLLNAGGEITLQSGPLLFDRPPDSVPAPMQIRSPFALMAVRGTRFFAGPSNGRFGVFVERGSVAVSSAGRRVILHDGEGTDFSAPGTRPTPVKRWGAERVQAALASIT